MSGGVPAGWVLVPVEPTEAMLHAAYLCGDGGSPKAVYEAMIAATPTPPIEGRDADVERECQAVWRCAIGDAVGALDVLRTQWEKSRRKHEREAGAKLSAVLDLVWAARDPAAVSYKEAHANGNALIARARAALQALGVRP